MVSQKAPSALLTCRDQPPGPINDDDRAFAAWIVDLAAAGQDCRDHLHAVKGLLDGQLNPSAH